MNLSIVPVSLTVSFGFLLLVPLIAMMKPLSAPPPAARPAACTESSGAALTSPAPHRFLPPQERTRCERDADCVSFFDDVLGLPMPEDAVAYVEQALAAQPFQCQTRVKPNGGKSMVCRLNTNHVTKAEHETALAAVIGGIRDRHGAERTLNSRRASDHIQEIWGWGTRRSGAKGRSLRVTSRWRYNPTGTGSPNGIKIAWQDSGG